MKFKYFLLSSLFSFAIVPSAISANLILNDGDNIQFTSDEIFNGGSGIYASAAVAQIYTTGNIISENNIIYGLYVLDSDLLVSGLNSKVFQLNNNGEYGIGGNNSLVLIKDMNIQANQNGRGGVYGHVEIIGDGNTYFHVNENIGFGIDSLNSSDTIIIHDMNVEINRNTENGASVANSGKIEIKGSDNTLHTNNNGLAGMVASDSGSEINIENMNIQANENGLYGIQSGSGGIINITGNSAGTNTLQTNNNNVTGTEGFGIYSTDTGSEVNIENMDVDASGNVVGVYAVDGAHIKIEGRSVGTNTLITNSNTGAIQTSGGGILAEKKSVIDIIGMNIESSYNGGSNFAALGSSIINITGVSSRNTLITKDSASGVAFFVSDQDIVSVPYINITNMNVYAETETLAYLKNYGAVSFINSDFYAPNNKLFTTENDAAINLDNVKFHGNSSVFLEAKNSIGITSYTDVYINNSEIMGSVVNEQNSRTYIDLSNSIWRSIGRSNVSNLSLIGSNDLYMSIYFGNSATQGDMLTIDNNISTSGGTNTLHLTSAGGDGGSADAIVINQENATGSTLN
ncbi:MAG: hypothetical protein ACK5N8_03215, partial [Alphaproteobacteria bacterium]